MYPVAMEALKKLAAPLGVLLVFASMSLGFDRAGDFISVIAAEDVGKPAEPPNITNNKVITGPKNG